MMLRKYILGCLCLLLPLFCVLADNDVSPPAPGDSHLPVLDVPNLPPEAATPPLPVTFSLRLFNTTKQRLDVQYLCPNTLNDPLSLKGTQWRTSIGKQTDKKLALEVAHPESKSYQCILLVNGEGENALMVRLLVNTRLEIKLCSAPLLGFHTKCQMHAGVEDNQYALTLSVSKSFL